MTIRRQYNLPNCTLILEGLTNGSTGQTDPRPLVSILVNAECHFNGYQEPLTGGRDFLTSLVMSTNAYAQEFLSGVPQAAHDREKLGVVQLQKGDREDLHRLMFRPEVEAPATAPTAAAPTDRAGQEVANQKILYDLNTVQLFDLVEAVDQFLADSRTLPDISVLLAPTSKRYAAKREPVARRAAPAAVGVASLALAAGALYFLPVTRVERPADPDPQPTPTETPPATPSSSTGMNQANAAPTPQESPSVETQLVATPDINDPSKLYFLQRRLYNQINQKWEKRSRVGERLVYRVSVNPQGAIVGYKAVDATPSDGADITPLPDLLAIPQASTKQNSESLGEFKVVFTQRGVLQVSPWYGYAYKPALGTKITDVSERRRLQKDLYEQIRQGWTGKPGYQRDLVYRVAVNQEGAIADYEPDNQPAFDYEKETPLPNLLKTTDSPATILQEPLAHYKVVFKPSGVLEVGNWR